jgi:hypothetical protein
LGNNNPRCWLKRPHDAKDENKITISNRLGLPMDNIHEKDPVFISIFMKSMDTRIYPWIGIIPTLS